jgi:hypothetical protein
MTALGDEDVCRLDVAMDDARWKQEGQIAVISGFPEPLPTQWFGRGQFSSPFSAAFRPLFSVGRSLACIYRL